MNQTPLPFIIVTTPEGRLVPPNIFEPKEIPRLSFFSPSNALRMTNEDWAIVFAGLEPLPP